MSGTVNCTFDLAQDGKQAGYLKVGDSTNNSGWTTYNVPIISIKNGDGPRALVLAGNHGDEYEGQIAATTLSRNLQPACHKRPREPEPDSGPMALTSIVFFQGTKTAR